MKAMPLPQHIFLTVCFSHAHFSCLLSFEATIIPSSLPHPSADTRVRAGEQPDPECLESAGEAAACYQEVGA